MFESNLHLNGIFRIALEVNLLNVAGKTEAMSSTTEAGNVALARICLLKRDEQ